MDARLLKGRTFTEEDMCETTHPAIIDQDVVRKHFGNLDPIGQRIQFNGFEHTVVGVVATLRDFRHLGPVTGIVYCPHTHYYGFMCLLVRADRDPAAVDRSDPRPDSRAGQDCRGRCRV